eukprot:TRINITY_DN3135_c0_g1_i2.p1 TRINITY_DN3135_c0_g1~~TRINITY_DN3135_c0_g1_i2.p1  ORF type:complete len:640 (+),score=192.95 TRINITY_DN3135_c0_g1_i2:62-1981(+)
MAKNRAEQELGRAKERVIDSAQRFSLGASSSGSSPEKAEARKFASPIKAKELNEEMEDKVERLVALGFSAPASRQALRACWGRVDEAGLWLLNEKNADEILAAELAAEEALPLIPGGSARVSGLRGAAALNGTVVVLQLWDKESERWVVTMPDGSVKSIRARNLDALSPAVVAKLPPDKPPADSAVGQQAVHSHAWASGYPSGSDASGYPSAKHAPEGDFAAPANASSASTAGAAALEPAPTLSGSDVDLKEMRALAKDMLLGMGHAAEDEVLQAMSAEELLDVIQSLSAVDSATPAETKQAAEPRAEEPQRLPDEGEEQLLRMAMEASLEGLDAATGSSSSSSARPGASAAGHGLLPEHQPPPDLVLRQQQLEEAEAKLSSLAEAQQKRALDLELREAELKAVEEKLARRRAEAEEAEKEAEAPAASSVPAADPVSPTSQDASKALEAELRVERDALEQMRLEVKTASEELERKKATMRQEQENRELHLLEEEAAQMRLASSLREEEARLAMQRKSLGMLQQAILKGAADRSSAGSEGGGVVEHSFQDDDHEAEPLATEEKVEATDSPVQAESAAGHAAESRAASEAQNPSEQDKRHEDDEDDEAQNPSEQDKRHEDDEDDEVWDLDWSALGNPKEKS